MSEKIPGPKTLFQRFNIALQNSWIDAQSREMFLRKWENCRIKDREKVLREIEDQIQSAINLWRSAQ